MKKSRKNTEGQSTVEFALTLLLLLSFVFFYFQLCMVFAFGNYVHYATFMAARAYLSAGPDRGDQKTRAQDVIVRMLKRSAGQAGVDKFPSIAKGFGGGGELTGLDADPPSQFVPGDPSSSWMEGVRYTFRSKLFLIPFGGRESNPQQGQGSVNSVTLTSESWLGREPAYDECQRDMGKDSWLFDNGC